ncbi:MAG TPA: serine/threonine-protein kinase [Gemmatimonadaceae bacterium]|jgi:serine/threonine-protein kinase|nr:serine/threonine-protein kinase [Gemmatimonadaceae bacterium]
MNRCPACGKTYDDDARFCTRDGSKLVAMPSRDISAAPAASADAPAASPPPRGTLGGRAEQPAPVTHGNLTGRVLDGRYRIARKIGEGGMSFVYLATDVATEERYAIKVLSAALSSDANAMARLRREASLGMRLAHPNVCHIIRLGETQDGLVYVVMPYVEGEVLSDRNNRLGTIPLADVVPFVRDIAAGLHVAHELKIVHRDLKPENVMICPKPSGGERAVVMDFGLAKERRADAELQKLTATGIILGTPEFMSPEQLRGRPLDPRTDIYSLTLMTYEMLTGKLPFSGRTQQEMMIARLRSEPVPLRAAAPALAFPEAVERVLAKGMQRDPGDRYATAPEFAQALSAAAKGGGKGGDSGVFGRLFGR